MSSENILLSFDTCICCIGVIRSSYLLVNLYKMDLFIFIWSARHENTSSAARWRRSDENSCLLSLKVMQWTQWSVLYSRVSAPTLVFYSSPARQSSSDRRTQQNALNARAAENLTQWRHANQLSTVQNVNMTGSQMNDLNMTQLYSRLVFLT